MSNILASENLNDDDRFAAIKMILVKISIYIEGARKHGNHQFVDEFLLLQQQYLSESSVNDKEIEHS